MANKKIWAYAIDEDGQYVKGIKHPLKIFYIWEVLKLRNSQIHEFNKLTFMSTSRDPKMRSKMSAVKNGFFRYKKGAKDTNESDGDGNSLSHSIAIHVLAEMDQIHFVCGSNKYTLEIEDIRSDDLKIQLTNRNTYSYYYPDILCFFKSPRNLSLKWGNKLAIEVRHTHECEEEKIQDFENHGIPIIEVNIKNISIEKKFNTKSPTPEQLEQYYFYLKNIFSNKVYGKILSDPVSVKYFNQKRTTLLELTEEKQAKIDHANRTIKRLENTEKAIIQENERFKEIITRKDKALAEQKITILKIDKRGLGYYLVNLLKFNK